MQFRIPSRRSKEKNTFIGICTHWYANFNLFLLLLLFYTVHCYFKISKGILFIYTVSFGRILGSLWACLFLHFELTISGTPKHMCFASPWLISHLEIFLDHSFWKFNLYPYLTRPIEGKHLIPGWKYFSVISSC